MGEDVRVGYGHTSQGGDGQQLRIAVKILLMCITILGLLWGLYALRTILLLLLLSLLLRYLLEPVVDVFSRGRLQIGKIGLPLPHLPRLLTICVVYLVGLAVFISLVLVVLPIALKEGRSLLENVPAYVAFIQEKAAHLAALYHRYNLPTAWQSFVDTSLTKGTQALLHLLETVVGELTTAVSYAWWLLLPPLLAFFLLKDGERLWEGFLSFFPDPLHRQRIAILLSDIEHVLATFIRTQLALCIIMGLWIVGLLTFLGIPYSFLLGILAAVFEFIPVFGPISAGVLICLVTVVRDPLLALWVALALIFLRIVQDYIVVPRVMGQHIHLHPAVIIVAVLCGAELAGIAGVFLATPAAAVIRVILVTWRQWRLGRTTPVLTAELSPTPATRTE